MAAKVYCSSPIDFPDPHRFGIWWNEHSFQVYRNLSMVKSAITGASNHEDRLRSNAVVYEHDGDDWQEIYRFARGDKKSDHELWKNGPAPKTRAVSETAVQAAIQSILGKEN